MRTPATPLSLLTSIIGCALAPHAIAGYTEHPTDFASAVTAYTRGTGVGIDFISAESFSNPNSALGRPTVDTTGDGTAGSPFASMTVVPIYPAFRASELVTVGLGGTLIVQLGKPAHDNPHNPFGIDFIIFGNAAQGIASGGSWNNTNPNNFSLSSFLFREPGTVSVSPGFTGAPGEIEAYPFTWAWHTFSTATGAPQADSFAPTLGRKYDANEPTFWGDPTDPTLPLDPALTPADFSDMTLAEVATEYAHSAGGTGFDIAALNVPGLTAINYVRIDGPASGFTPEVDAVSVVAPACPHADHDSDGNLDRHDLAVYLSDLNTEAASAQRLAPLAADGVSPDTFDLLDLLDAAAGCLP